MGMRWDSAHSFLLPGHTLWWCSATSSRSVLPSPRELSAPEEARGSSWPRAAGRIRRKHCVCIFSYSWLLSLHWIQFLYHYCIIPFKFHLKRSIFIQIPYKCHLYNYSFAIWREKSSPSDLLSCLGTACLSLWASRSHKTPVMCTSFHPSLFSLSYFCFPSVKLSSLFAEHGAQRGSPQPHIGLSCYAAPTALLTHPSREREQQSCKQKQTRAPIALLHSQGSVVWAHTFCFLLPFSSLCLLAVVQANCPPAQLAPGPADSSLVCWLTAKPAHLANELNGP